MEYTVLSKLEKYLTLQNIELKKNIFLQGYLENESDKINYIDIINGVVELKNYETNDIETYYFADTLENEFGNLTETKKAIDTAFIELNFSSQRTEFIKYLTNTIKIIVKSEKKMFSDYPVLKKVILNLVHYINEKHDCSLDYPFNIALLKLPKYTPPFIILKKYEDEKKFKRLYRLFVKNLIIKSELITEENFIEIFMGKETIEHITFRIDSPNTVMVLNSLKHIYNKFRPIDIGRSKRFYTSNDKPLSDTNYTSINSRIKKNNIQPTDNTKETIKEIEKIFPQKLNTDL